MKAGIANLLEKIIEKIKFIFPENREIAQLVSQEIDAGSACFKVDWPLHDKSRPNKRSKQIWLVLNREFFEDYQGLTVIQKQDVINQACKWIEMQYTHFDDSNFEPQNRTSPKEIWHIPFIR